MTDSYFQNGALAARLYEHTRSLPIIDYHNHLNIVELNENYHYENITRLWITPDPYKHRLMRISGIDERLITGDRSDKECFEAWCSCFPTLAGTPVYDWSLLELRTVFNTNIYPCTENSDRLWEELNAKLCGDITSHTLLDNFNVEYAAPCTSIADDISFYMDSGRLAPSLRGDDIVKPDAAFVKKLSDASEREIKNLDDFLLSVSERLLDFKAVGCRFCDHGQDDGFVFYEDDGKNNVRFSNMMNDSITETDSEKLASCILTRLGVMYKKNGFVMQLHIGALRHTSTRLREIAGLAGGFAGIGQINISSITRLLDSIEKEAGALPKTILFTLNPAYNAAISVLCGSYSDGKTPALVSQGPAWWWCDHIKGIKEVLDDFSAYGVIYRFPGMTTDSRSILSFARHDYFRRLFCNWAADKAEKGELPNDYKALRTLCERVCYKNALEMIENVF